jgi:hypothetical protein
MTCNAHCLSESNDGKHTHTTFMRGRLSVIQRFNCGVQLKAKQSHIINLFLIFLFIAE